MTDLCACGQRQTVIHVVDLCPLTELEGRVQSLHEAGDEAVHCLENTTATAFTK